MSLDTSNSTAVGSFSIQSLTFQNLVSVCNIPSSLGFDSILQGQKLSGCTHVCLPALGALLRPFYAPSPCNQHSPSFPRARGPSEPWARPLLPKGGTSARARERRAVGKCGAGSPLYRGWYGAPRALLALLKRAGLVNLAVLVPQGGGGVLDC